jgi:hypothetical protein
MHHTAMVNPPTSDCHAIVFGPSTGGSDSPKEHPSKEPVSLTFGEPPCSSNDTCLPIRKRRPHDHPDTKKDFDCTAISCIRAWPRGGELLDLLFHSKVAHTSKVSLSARPIAVLHGPALSRVHCITCTIVLAVVPVCHLTYSLLIAHRADAARRLRAGSATLPMQTRAAEE